MDKLNEKKEKKRSLNYTRTLILLLVAIVLAFGLQLLLYTNNFTSENISNVLFIMGIIIFFPSLISVSGAFQVTYGIRYVLRTLYDRHYREEVRNFDEYKARKELKKENRTTVYWELLIIGGLFIIAAIIVLRLL